MVPHVTEWQIAPPASIGPPLLLPLLPPLLLPLLLLEPPASGHSVIVPAVHRPFALVHADWSVDALLPADARAPAQ